MALLPKPNRLDCTSPPLILRFVVSPTFSLVRRVSPGQSNSEKKRFECGLES